MGASCTGEVVLSEVISKGILLLRIKLLEPHSVAFKAGQYIALSVPNAKKQSYYSIASSPNRAGEIELLIKEDATGAGSSYLFSLKLGDSLHFNMPLGTAFLQEDSEHNIIFVAGASGASYIRSMIHYLDETKQLAKRDIYYFLGAREADELLEPDFMHQLAEKHSRFHFIPALSEQEDWDGHTGLVTDVIQKIMPENMSQWDVYCAGSFPMVKAVAETLIEHKNIQPSRFFSDLYTPETKEN